MHGFGLRVCLGCRLIYLRMDWFVLDWLVVRVFAADGIGLCLCSGAFGLGAWAAWRLPLGGLRVVWVLWVGC